MSQQNETIPTATIAICSGTVRKTGNPCMNKVKRDGLCGMHAPKVEKKPVIEDGRSRCIGTTGESMLESDPFYQAMKIVYGIPKREKLGRCHHTAYNGSTVCARHGGPKGPSFVTIEEK